MLRKTSTSFSRPSTAQVTGGMQGGVSWNCFAAFAAVLSSTAAKVGVGMGLGTKVANAVNAVVAPAVAKMLRTLRDRALSNKDIQQAVEDMSEAAGVDDDDVRGWVESIIGLCASALGIYVAHRLDDVVFLYGACGAGAALAVDKCAELGFSFKPRARHLVVGALAFGAGFAYQTTGIGPACHSSSAGRCSRSARRRRASRPWPTASAPPTRGRREITRRPSLGAPCMVCVHSAFDVLLGLGATKPATTRKPASKQISHSVGR